MPLNASILIKKCKRKVEKWGGGEGEDGYASTIGNGKIRATLKEDRSTGISLQTWRDPLKMTSDPYSFRVERNNEIGNELRWMPREGKEKTRNGLHFLGRKLHARNEGWILESTRVRKRIQSWNVGKKEEGNGIVFSRCAGSRCRSEAVDLRRLITNLCAGRIGRYLCHCNFCRCRLRRAPN